MIKETISYNYLSESDYMEELRKETISRNINANMLRRYRHERQQCISTGKPSLYWDRKIANLLDGKNP